MAKKSIIKLFTPVILGVLVLSTYLFASPVFAEGECPEGKVKTSLWGCVDGGNGDGIFFILNIVLTVLTYGVGIAGTLGIILCGIQYLTAKDNEQKVAKAKSNLFNIVIGLIAYALLWSFLQWLLPGGILNGSGS